MFEQYLHLCVWLRGMMRRKLDVWGYLPCPDVMLAGADGSGDGWFRIDSRLCFVRKLLKFGYLLSLCCISLAQISTIISFVAYPTYSCSD